MLNCDFIGSCLFKTFSIQRLCSALVIYPSDHVPRAWAMPVDFLGALALRKLYLESQGHLGTAAGGAASQKQEGEKLCPTAATFLFSVYCAVFHWLVLQLVLLY